MFRCITNIKITQIQKNGDGRTASYTFGFANKYSATSSWADLTNQATVVIPKNVFVRDATGNLISIYGKDKKKQIADMFRKGDKIEISYGYYVRENGGDKEVVDQIFKGFICAVGSKMPIELSCEDNMYQLKQIPCTPQVWSKDKTVEDLMKSLLTGTGFTVNGLTETKVGDLIIQDETVAQLISRLRNDYHLEAYFYGDELRIGSVVYIDSEAVSNNFIFQQNIISDELVFQRRDDVTLSVVCESINTKEGSANNKRGQKTTTEERLTVLVYYDKDGIPQYKEKKKGVDFPGNLEGERRKLFFPNIKSATELAQFGIDELSKYYYTGFRGKFTTFAYPFVKMGDTVCFFDKILPDRDGNYRVKSVEYTGGVDGHRQIIELHYKLA